MSDKGLHPYNTKSMDDRTRAMILDPSTWPLGQLPMKRRGEDMVFGFINFPAARQCAETGKLTIFRNLSPKHVHGDNFESIDDALRAGWTVD